MNFRLWITNVHYSIAITWPLIVILVHISFSCLFFS